MTRRKKRKTALFGIENKPIALEYLTRRKPSPDVAQLSPILRKVDNAAGQNELRKRFKPIRAKPTLARRRS